MKQRITGIILSGGKSSRMGTDKGLQMLNGKPLIQYSIDVLEDICDEIIICANKPGYNSFGYRVYKDIYPGLGPIGGLYTGLENSGSENNFVLSCDMPFINSQIIKYIIFENESSIANVPVHGKQMTEPLCARYSRSVLTALYGQIKMEDLKLMNLLKIIDTGRVKIGSGLDFFHPALFYNINDKTSLEIAETIMQGNRDQ